MKKIYILILVIFCLISCREKEQEISDSLNLSGQDDLFEFQMPDTISLGKHLGRIIKYKRDRKPGYDYLLSVIVENEYENSKTKKDTFSDGTLKPFFGINGFETGTHVIKLVIEEQIIKPPKTELDSFLPITKKYYQYDTKITVVDGDYVSDIERDLKIQLKNK